MEFTAYQVESAETLEDPTGVIPSPITRADSPWGRRWHRACSQQTATSRRYAGISCHARVLMRGTLEGSRTRRSSPCTEAGGGWRGPAAGTASPHALASVRAFRRSRYEARRSSPLRIVTGGEWMFQFCFPGRPRGRRVLGALAGGRCLRALGVAPGVSGQVGGTGRASLARYQRVWATACKLKFCNVITF